MRHLLSFVLVCFSLGWCCAQTQVSVKIKKEVNGQTTVEEKNFQLLPGETLEEALIRNGVDKTGSKEFSISIEDQNAKDERLKAQGKRLSIEGLPFIEMPPFAPRAYLGVTLRNGKHHPIITDIAQMSPAAKANLTIGDVILKVDGFPVHHSEDIVNIIRTKSPNESVVLKIKRHHKKLKMTVPLEAIQTAPLMEDFPFPFGNFPELRIEQLEFDQKSSAFLGVTPRNDFSDMGVKVDSVISNSAAEKMGLKKNDIIIALNGHSIENFDALKDAIGASNPGDACEVTIIRDDKTSIIKGNFGSKALIEKDGYRIYRNDKGLDDQGQLNLDYEFDLDELEKMDSTIQLQFNENGIVIAPVKNLDQISIQKLEEEKIKALSPNGLSNAQFEQMSFIPQLKNEWIQIHLVASNPSSVKVVVENSQGAALFSDERTKAIVDYQNNIQYHGWEKGEYKLLIYQNDALVIAKKLVIE